MIQTHAHTNMGSVVLMKYVTVKKFKSALNFIWHFQLVCKKKNEIYFLQQKLSNQINEKLLNFLPFLDISLTCIFDHLVWRRTAAGHFKSVDHP